MDRRGVLAFRPCLAHAGNIVVIGAFSGALLVEGAGLDPAIVNQLDIVLLAVVAGWIMRSGQLSRGAAFPRTHQVHTHAV